MGYWYLATPYSKHPEGIEEAHDQACEQAAFLIQEASLPVYCPIAHTHPIAMAGEIDPLSQEIWLVMDEPLMAAAEGIIVCRLESWEESRGIKAEIEHFVHAGKEVVWMEPGVLPERFRPEGYVEPTPVDDEDAGTSLVEKLKSTLSRTPRDGPEAA